MRVFALGPKLSLSWLESRTTYRDKLFALFDRRLRGPGTPLIQRGADDVASHLRGPSDPRRPVQTARDLVVWPESLGLFAALTGSRGAAGRASGSLEGSIVSLIGAYAPTNAYYAARFPALEPCPADPPADAFTDPTPSAGRCWSRCRDRCSRRAPNHIYPATLSAFALMSDDDPPRSRHRQPRAGRLASSR